MNTRIVAVILASTMVVVSFCPAQDAGEKKDTGTKETITVIKPGDDGDIKILSTKRSTAKDPAAVKAAREAVTDNTPRKARIVVVPAAYAQEVRSKGARELNEKFGISGDSILENPNYTAFLTDALVNCRKFDVLEREDLVALKKELDLGESEYADVKKVTKLGKMLNADYVILPQIRFCEFIAAPATPYVGNAGERLQVKVDIWLKAVDVATSRIASSAMLSTKIRRSKKQKESAAEWVTNAKDEVYKNSALEGAARIIDIVYPVKVLSIDGKNCVLNRGTGAVVEEEVFNVYNPGEMLMDPDTKENLGSQDTLVGKIKVVEVKDKTCIAEIIEGAGKIEKLSICRRVNKPGVTEMPAPRID
jgi:hypothetical protein